MKGKGTRLAKTVLTKKYKVGGITLRSIKACRAPVVQTGWSWGNGGHKSEEQKTAQKQTHKVCSVVVLTKVPQQSNGGMTQQMALEQLNRDKKSST